MERSKRIRMLVILAIGLAFGLQAAAEEKSEKTSFPVREWLVLESVQVRLPAFHDVKNMKGETFGMGDLLTFRHADVETWRPKAGESVRWDRERPLAWERVLGDTLGVILEKFGDSPEIAYLSAYIHADRFTKATLHVSGYHLFRVFVDGEYLFEKAESEKPKDDSTPVEAKKMSKEIHLETGTHLLVVKALKDPACGAEWLVKAGLEASGAAGIVVDASPAQVMTVARMMDSPTVRNLAISPDGELAAVGITQTCPITDKRESRVEILRVKDGTPVWTLLDADASSIRWAPSGRRLSYRSDEGGKSALLLSDPGRGRTEIILKDAENFGDYTWAPDGSFIVYSLSQDPKENKTGMKRIQGMPDRLPGARSRSFLYEVRVPEGTRRRLTAGRLSTNLNAIHPDGSTLIFSRTEHDFSEKPFRRETYFTLDLNSLTVDTLFQSRWIQSVRWSPDGDRLLVLGGPLTFDGMGKNVPEGMIPNDSDTQAFLFDPETEEARAISRDFDPSIQSGVWSTSGDAIYFLAEDTSYRRIFRYDVKKGGYRSLDAAVEVVREMDLALNAPVMVYQGSGASGRPMAYAMDLKKGRSRVLIDPAGEDYRDVRFGDVKRWTFTNSRDLEIEGRVYYPPGFDAGKPYPCIVYYYGGTSPVTRDFAGRYPKEIWAANGYVVYVLQPSGATGFGQAFSALHVNDWGRIASEDVIEGTEKFLDAHPFVDRERVGCIGASYGGFMTMLLVTRTDLFAAAVSHAGISSISSYWGEGFWGYWYLGLSATGSFPWNRKDLYVDQSPLFSADRVNTPLLMTHGAADTNVPPGESRQFYAALKLLGKEVELIEVDDQNHWIMDYDKRIRWTKSIIAWFDRWLKDRPEWWEELYPDEE